MSLAESVWGDNIDQADSFGLYLFSSENLRRKLKQADATVELKAVYGFGYKLLSHETSPLYLPKALVIATSC